MGDVNSPVLSVPHPSPVGSYCVLIVLPHKTQTTRGEGAQNPKTPIGCRARKTLKPQEGAGWSSRRLPMKTSKLSALHVVQAYEAAPLTH